MTTDSAKKDAAFYIPRFGSKARALFDYLQAHKGEWIESRVLSSLFHPRFGATVHSLRDNGHIIETERREGDEFVYMYVGHDESLATMRADNKGHCKHCTPMAREIAELRQRIDALESVLTPLSVGGSDEHQNSGYRGDI